MEDRLLNLVLPYLSDWGYYVVFLMTFLETSAFVGLLVPGETIVILAGLFAGSGSLNVGIVIGVASVGAVLGDTVGYFLGYRFGESFFRRYGHYFFFKPQYLDQARDFFEAHGGKTVFLGRFMGWLRAFAPVVAGISHMPYYRFLFANVCGAVVWATSFTLIGYFVGNNWNVIEKYIGRAGAIALITGTLGIYLYFGLLRGQRRAARRLLSKPG